MKKNDDTIEDGEDKATESTEDTVPEEDLEEELPRQSEDPAEDASRVWEDKYKRALADYQNLEKRVAFQRRELIISASRNVIERLLPVLDTLELASMHTEDQGMKMSIQQFLDVLKAEGVEKIEAKGKKFDPVHMEAVGTQPGDEGKVLEEARAGYLLNDKLLRPAQVIVGAK